MTPPEIDSKHRSTRSASLVEPSTITTTTATTAASYDKMARTRPPSTTTQNNNSGTPPRSRGILLKVTTTTRPERSSSLPPSPSSSDELNHTILVHHHSKSITMTQPLPTTIAMAAPPNGAGGEGLLFLRSSIVDHCTTLPKTRAEFETQQQRRRINLLAVKGPRSSSMPHEGDWERFLAQMADLHPAKPHRANPGAEDDDDVFDDE